MAKNPSLQEIGLMNEIQRVVAKYHNINPEELSGQKRHQSISVPRGLAMFLARVLHNISYPHIGLGFGGKDHSTVITACKKWARKCEGPNGAQTVLLLQTLAQDLNLALPPVKDWNTPRPRTIESPA